MEKIVCSAAEAPEKPVVLSPTGAHAAGEGAHGGGTERAAGKGAHGCATG